MNSVSTLNTGQMNTTYREPLPARLARGLIRIISELVTLSVITFFLLMFLYASWSIYDAQRIFSGADTTVYETYKPESDVDDSPTFQELVAINPDVLGWITVYGTGIDYPLVQGETNDSYINTSVEKKFSLSGSIFLDSANEPDFSDFNTIIHGHHMEKHEMFGTWICSGKKHFSIPMSMGTSITGVKTTDCSSSPSSTAMPIIRNSTIRRSRIPEDRNT